MNGAPAGMCGAGFLAPAMAASHNGLHMHQATAMTRDRTAAARPSQTGATLIEVLVAILILTFGLLGAAGMLLNSLRAANETSSFVTATNLARELGERTRGNWNVASASEAAAANPYIVDLSGTNAPPTPPVDCNAATCTPAQLAAWDISEWWVRASQIPGARVVVCYDGAPFDSGAGAYRWGCAAGSTPANSPLVVKFGWASKTATGEWDPSSTNQASGGAPRVVVQSLPGPAGT
jgi:type IV pilus assembly protein PilV